MGMQIDGNSVSAQDSAYSRRSLPGEKPREKASDGAVSGVKEQKNSKAAKSIPNAPAAGSKSEDPEKDAEVQRQIQELLQIQNKVIVHEQAHMAAGGGLAGAASYSYTNGPDGKRYITGGEVSISTPPVKDPEEKIRVMAKVRAAALAPADPSPQDRSVAAAASAQQAQASMELARKRAEEAYSNSTGQKATESQGKKAAKKPEPGSGIDLSI